VALGRFDDLTIHGFQTHATGILTPHQQNNKITYPRNNLSSITHVSRSHLDWIVPIIA